MKPFSLLMLGLAASAPADRKAGGCEPSRAPLELREPQFGLLSLLPAPILPSLSLSPSLPSVAFPSLLLPSLPLPSIGLPSLPLPSLGLPTPEPSPTGTPPPETSPAGTPPPESSTTTTQAPALTGAPAPPLSSGAGLGGLIPPLSIPGLGLGGTTSTARATAPSSLTSGAGLGDLGGFIPTISIPGLGGATMTTVATTTTASSSSAPGGTATGAVASSSTPAVACRGVFAAAAWAPLALVLALVLWTHV